MSSIRGQLLFFVWGFGGFGDEANFPLNPWGRTLMHVKGTGTFVEKNGLKETDLGMALAIVDP